MRTRREALGVAGSLVAAPILAVRRAAAMGRDARDVRLSRRGNLLVRADGERFVVRGAAQYALNRDWQAPCDAYHHHRAAVFARFVELGINTQRLGFWASSYVNDEGFLDRREQRQRLVDLCRDAAGAGLYTIVGLWDTLGVHDEAALENVRRVGLPVLRDLLDTPGIGDNPYVLFEPWNEPGMIEGDDWRRHFEITIAHLRRHGYESTIFVDTPFWSWDFAAALERGDIDYLLRVDADLCFCNHRYPKGDLCSFHQYLGAQRQQHYDEVMAYVEHYPIMGSEYGVHAHFNGLSQNHPIWMKQLLDTFVSIDIPRGMNGACLWKWKWSTDTLTPFEDYSQEGLTTLNDYGLIAHRHFWGTREADPAWREPQIGAVELSTRKPRIGRSLQAHPSDISGFPFPQIVFSWERADGQGEELGSENTYVPRAADYGRALVCRVGARSAGGEIVWRRSAPTAPVTGPLSKPSDDEEARECAGAPP